MPYRANEPRRHAIPKARYRIEPVPAYDGVVMFKIRVSQVICGLSDDQAEFQILAPRTRVAWSAKLKRDDEG